MNGWSQHQTSQLANVNLLIITDKLCIGRFRGGRGATPFSEFHTVYCSLGKLWKKTAQEKPKSLPPDGFSGLQICQIVIVAEALPWTRLGQPITFPRLLVEFSGLYSPISWEEKGGYEAERWKGRGRIRMGGLEIVVPSLKISWICPVMCMCWTFSPYHL